MRNNHLIKSVAVFSMLASACSRPTNCAAGKCDNKVSPAFAQPAATGGSSAEKDGGSGTPVIQPASGDTQGISQLAAAVEAMKALVQLQDMIKKLEQEIIILEDRHFASLQRGVDALTSVSDALTAWQAQAAEELAKATETYKNEGAKLHLNLEAFAAEREDLRLALFLEVEAAEASLMQALQPGGIYLQRLWDDNYLKVLDRLREQSRTQEIIALRSKMLQAIKDQNLTNQAALETAIYDLIGKNQALVTANAPANADRALIVMSELEKAIATAPAIPAVQKALGDKLAATQERIKLALDAINPEFFKQVEQLVMRREIAKATVAGLTSGVDYFKDFGKNQAEKLGAIKAKIAELNIAAIALRMKPVSAPQNGQIIGPSLGATTAVIGVVGQRIDAIVTGIAEFQSTLLEIIKAKDGRTLLAGIDPSGTGSITEQVAALEAGEDALSQAITQISGSLQNLAVIFESKSGCSAGTVSLAQEMPVNTINCGSQEYTILDAPPQPPTTAATN